MKKDFYIGLFMLVAGSVLALLLIFGGKPEKLKSWWQEYSHDSDMLPWCPYKTRVAATADIHLKEASRIVFVDSNLFWKGEGANAGPELGQKDIVVSFVVTSGGSGYSPRTTAKIAGSGSENFELGKVVVEGGRVMSVRLIKTGTWYETPRVHIRDKDGRMEELPFSGTTELKFDNGQIRERKQYLSGEPHGKWERFQQDGIKVFVQEFLRGKKHGQHIYWFDEPLDPDDYKTQSDAHLKKKVYASLWLEVHEDARKKFPDYPSPEANEWAIKKHGDRGGTFQVRLLEHYEGNLRHGLFEGFDYLGNQTFKDEYKHGLRTSHRTYDKIKKG